MYSLLSSTALKENINFNYVLEELLEFVSLGALHCGLCWAHWSSSRALSAAESTQWHQVCSLQLSLDMAPVRGT